MNMDELMTIIGREFVDYVLQKNQLLKEIERLREENANLQRVHGSENLLDSDAKGSKGTRKTDS